MFTSDAKKNEAWMAAGATLGLHAYLTCEKYRGTETFRQVHSRLGGRSLGGDATEHVLAGLRDGARVMLTCHLQDRKILTDGPDGTKEQSYWTTILVELDPPSFMGLRVARSTFLGDLFQGKDVQLGVPEADKALHITALDADKVRSVLAPTQPDDAAFLASLVKAVGDGFFFTDTMVGVDLIGRVTDAAVLDRHLTAALWFRHELGRRVGRAFLRPHEQQARAEWAAFAEASGMKLEPTQMKLHGVVDKVPIEVALETAPGRIQTAVSLRWPRPIALHLRVSKYDLRESGKPDAAVLTSTHFTMGRFVRDHMLGDIRVGDKPFDDAFLVLGYPEPMVREVLASPALRGSLVTIANVAHEINLTGEGVSWFIDAPVVRAADLDQHVRMAVQTGLAMHPQLEAVAPYR